MLIVKIENQHFNLSNNVSFIFFSLRDDFVVKYTLTFLLNLVYKDRCFLNYLLDTGLEIFIYVYIIFGRILKVFLICKIKSENKFF